MQVLLRTGGPEVRIKITRIDQETLTPEQQAHFINLIKGHWSAPEEGALGRLRRLGGPGLVHSRDHVVSKRRMPREKEMLDQEGQEGKLNKFISFNRFVYLKNNI